MAQKKDEFFISECAVCNIKDQHLKKADWRNHLLGQKHQKCNRKQIIIPKESLDKSVTVIGVKECKNVENEFFFEHFWKVGPILNIEIQSSASGDKVVHLEFQTKEMATSALEFKHEIKGIPVKLFRRRPAKRKNNPSLQLDKSKSDEDIPDSRLMTDIKKLENNLTYEKLMEMIQDRLLLTNQEHEQRVALCSHLQDMLRVRFGEASVSPFGSSVSGLGFHGCDMDIYAFIDIPRRSLLGTESQATDAEKVFILAKILRKTDDVDSVVSIPFARVPIVKFRAKSININCDVSFRNLMACQNSRLIRWFADSDPRVRLFLVTLRFWARRKEVAGGKYSPMKLSSYCLTMAAINFLQQLDPPVLPSVAKLQSHTSPFVVDGWNAAYYTGCAAPSRNTSTSFELLKQFFEFFASFDFPMLILSPLLGRVMHRTELLNVNKPSIGKDAPLALYRKRVSVGDVEPIELDRPCILMDPFELNVNIARNVRLEGINRFQAFCQKASVTKKFSDLLSIEQLPKKVTDGSKKRKSDEASVSKTEKEHFGNKKSVSDEQSSSTIIQPQPPGVEEETTDQSVCKVPPTIPIDVLVKKRAKKEEAEENANLSRETLKDESKDLTEEEINVEIKEKDVEIKGKEKREKNEPKMKVGEIDIEIEGKDVKIQEKDVKREIEKKEPEMKVEKMSGKEIEVKIKEKDVEIQEKKRKRKIEKKEPELETEEKGKLEEEDSETKEPAEKKIKISTEDLDQLLIDFDRVADYVIPLKTRARPDGTALPSARDGTDAWCNLIGETTKKFFSQAFQFQTAEIDVEQFGALPVKIVRCFRCTVYARTWDHRRSYMKSTKSKYPSASPMDIEILLCRKVLAAHIKRCKKPIFKFRCYLILETVKPPAIACCFYSDPLDNISKNYFDFVMNKMPDLYEEMGLINYKDVPRKRRKT